MTAELVETRPETATSLLLPPGTRLVHIGPQKTGTTTLQSAFHVSRAALEAQGVEYAARARQPMRAALAVVGRPLHAMTDEPAPISEWERLVRLIQRADAPRIVLSAEALSDAKPDAIRRIVGDLDPARIHIAVTLRPLTRILPSQWQQYVQAGVTIGFDDWLHAVLESERSRVTPSFWRRHRHDRLIKRWADVVGPERITVVVADDRDRDRILRVFEQLVGLSEGTLVPDPDLMNRSLTLGEAEMIRAFNIAFREADLPMALHTLVMRRSASELIKRRPPATDELKIRLPAWAAERAAEIARDIVDNIRASDVRVVGDLETLVELPDSGTPGQPQEWVPVTPETAAFGALSMLIATGVVRRERGRMGAADDATSGARGRELEDAEGLHRVRSRQIASVLTRRAETRVAGVWRRIPDPVRTGWLQVIPRSYRSVRAFVRR
ncbi:MAG TPA: hypothetical protein VGK63_06840 [Candidatus Limnocylindrales bacterium]